MLSLLSTYDYTLTGTGKANVVVKLDGSDYREYTVDFSKGKVTKTKEYAYEIPSINPGGDDTDTPDDTADGEGTVG